MLLSNSDELDMEFLEWDLEDGDWSTIQMELWVLTHEVMG